MPRRATASPAPQAAATSTATTTATTPKSTKTRRPSPKRRASASPARDVAGVKNITRKVIRTLEGLGHQQLLEDEDEEGEVERAVIQGDNRNINTAMDKGKARAVEDPIRKVDWEIPRKVFHSSIGFITLGLYLTPSISPRAVTLVLWSALAVIAPTDFVRLRYPAVERVYERVLGFLMRESEKHSTNGTLWYILGVNFALTFYPIDVATVAVLILSWADTAASTIGRLYGPRTAPLPARQRRLRLPFAPRKSVAGFAAACAVGALVALVFWGGVAGMRVQRAAGGSGASATPARYGVGGWAGLVLVAVVAGLVSGVAEALDLGGLDDNLTLPIISGGALMVFFRLCGWVVGAA
ncbi:hypothetical protein C8J57DRAFT_1059070 [Mycena rebaudengoi]|nr:hypothetical protein C8J57DRAFT_1059070 [Mycena rebaudengoi]